jgi:hypothetical protein
MCSYQISTSRFVTMYFFVTYILYSPVSKWLARPLLPPICQRRGLIETMRIHVGWNREKKFCLDLVAGRPSSMVCATHHMRWTRGTTTTQCRSHVFGSPVQNHYLFLYMLHLDKLRWDMLACLVAHVGLNKLRWDVVWLLIWLENRIFYR